MSIWAKTKLLCVVLCFLVPMAAAQEFSALARLDVAQSGAQDQRRGVTIDLYLSQPVPFRVFTLDEPRRLVLDFREVDFRGVTPEAYTTSAAFGGARFGPLRPGWSRMILDLEGPMAVVQAGMRVDPVDGTATIKVELHPSTAQTYEQAAGAPADPDWAFLMQVDPDPPAASGANTARADGTVVVVIDPGHGGIDPGAVFADVQEADVTLALAKELAAALARVEGLRPVLTREQDVFVPLQERLTLARRERADLFISLHADALEGEQASGATVYTLTTAASAAASQRIAERHDGQDILAGVDLSGQGDEVATILMDLARLESAASGERFADHLVQALADTGAGLNTRPRREAALAVLNAADFPSVLLEAGFLSNDADRARLTTAQGRAPIVAAVTLAVGRWAIEQEALAPLVRQ